MYLTKIQRRLLQAIDRDGLTHGFSTQSINSLLRRGLIELATTGTPHPTNPYAFWRLTKAGRLTRWLENV